MRAYIFCGIYLLAFLLPANAQQTLPFCPADCDGNRVVSVDELITVAGIASGRDALYSCETADSNADHIVSIDELVDAVANALGGCPGPGRGQHRPYGPLLFLHRGIPGRGGNGPGRRLCQKRLCAAAGPGHSPDHAPGGESAPHP